ncbi:hybrid signal transduction histidine kinase A-like [Homarus americanus]|uniref:hybrid signal transduction histidine kinase A-like n=1 Tax=Homarus americanus TaxID=6706 RepID=UPI001C46A8C2|nr:hybrid signal transduction histidine kinase A-like [Homarus americanus]
MASKPPLGAQRSLDIRDKCVVGGLRWRKRGQGSVTSEASSGEEETRTVRERRPRHHTPDPPRRILTRLEKQNSTEDSTSSSSGNSTPDHRPTRRPYRNSRLQNINNTGHSDTDIVSISSSISSSNSSSFNTSTSGSNTSASSTSTSSSSTPEPELPSRPPSRRVAAAAALRQKLGIHRATGGKRGPTNNGATRRPTQRWRSVSPVTRTPQPSSPSTTLYSNKNKNNNENNRNSTNCEESISKSQKRKNNSPNRASNKNNKCGTAIEIPVKGDDLLESRSELSPKKDIRKETDITNAISSSEDPIVVYEKTNFLNRTPPNRRAVENRSSNNRKPTLNLNKDLSPNKTVPSQLLIKKDSPGRVTASCKPYKEKEESVDQTCTTPESKYISPESSNTVIKENVNRKTSAVVPPTSSSIYNEEVFIIEPCKEESANKTSPVSAIKTEETTRKPVLKNFKKELVTKEPPVLSNSSKDENSKRTFPSGALVTAGETPRNENQCKSEAAVEILLDSEKGKFACEKLPETKEEKTPAKVELEKPSASLEGKNSSTDSTNVFPCTCSKASISDTLVTTTAVVRKPSLSEDDVVIEATSVIRTAGDSSSAIVSQHDKSVRSAILGPSANSVVWSYLVFRKQQGEL